MACPPRDTVHAMNYLLYISAAICAYLIAGWNPAITLSRAVYKKDIREYGSGNAGFTNFKRSFGMRLAWVACARSVQGCRCRERFCFALRAHARTLAARRSHTGFIAVLGHAFPIWYGFKGGKGFLVGLSTVYVIDWRVGLIATLIMIVLLFTTKYMSLSTVTAMLCCPILLALFGAARPTVLIEAATVLFIALRHKENFKRLVAGTESKIRTRLALSVVDHTRPQTKKGDRRGGNIHTI